MKPDVIIPDIKSSTIASTDFHQFVGGFVIDLPCIITIDNTLFVKDDYTLVDFTDNYGFIDTAVKVIDASLRGFEVTIVLLDLKTGELIKRKHRLGNDDLPCHWILTDLFSSNSKSDELLEFCF